VTTIAKKGNDESVTKKALTKKQQKVLLAFETEQVAVGRQ